MDVIVCDRVSKIFKRHTGQRLIREHIVAWMKRQKTAPFHALRDVSFRVPKGASLGVCGGNGAGKSTLLNLITGLGRPETGTITVNGRVAALLELGAGFHPDLTGGENLRLNAALMGFSRQQTARLFDSIVEFSGVGEFINEPLRTYSNGMVLRLAFSTAINVDPDILLIDEILAVGDQAFQQKCRSRIAGLRRRGTTLVCVSHSPHMLAELCDLGLWLDRGEVILQGPLSEVIEAYQGRLVDCPSGMVASPRPD
jgi:ABC-type polysaccharide/polyol phosphate transport system ATPase subunit